MTLPKDQLKDESKKQHKCNYCEKCFKLKGDLLKHKRTHTGENRFECKSCPRKFSDKAHLVRHTRRIHTGEKPFKCEYCQKSFADPDNLRYHERVHTGEKPCQCEHCPKSFASPNNLSRHKKTHTGETPFECQFCDYSAAYKQNLTTHERTHTGEKPYSCTFCDFSSNQKSHIAGHERQWHGTKQKRGKKPQEMELAISITKSARSSITLSEGLGGQVHSKEGQSSSAFESTKLLCKICEFTAGSDKDGALHMNVLHNLPVVTIQRLSGSGLSY